MVSFSRTVSSLFRGQAATTEKDIISMNEDEIMTKITKIPIFP